MLTKFVDEICGMSKKSRAHKFCYTPNPFDKDAPIALVHRSIRQDNTDSKVVKASAPYVEVWGDILRSS